jgi:hypothetical protein
MPQPCRWSCMAAAAMQYEMASRAARTGIDCHRSLLAAHRHQK